LGEDSVFLARREEVERSGLRDLFATQPGALGTGEYAK